MPDRPNVVVIMTDQQRADHSAREGYPLDPTPFLDQLATEGRWFDRAYTTNPLCAPARTSFLTGRFPTASRVWNNDPSSATYDRDIIDAFGDAGYVTGLSGKNHSHLHSDRTDFWYEQGHQGPSDTSDLDDEHRAFVDWMNDLYHGVSTEPTPFPVELQNPYQAVSHAQGWLESIDDDPFFLWLSIPEPHNPYQAPEPYFSMFPPEDLPPVEAGAEALEEKGFDWEWTRHLGEHVYPDYGDLLPRMRSNYLGMLRLIDDQIRRFVGFLDDAGFREDTILAFVSDHGDFVGEYGLMRKGVGLPEVLTRIPLQFAGRGVEADAEPHPAHVSIADLLPTLCEACGIDIPDGVQGRSLWPLLAGDDYPEAEFASAYAEMGVGGLPVGPEDDPDEEEMLLIGETNETFGEFNAVTASGRACMVRKGRWKLVFEATGEGRLYDLESDPRELDDRYDDPDCAAVRTDLLEELLGWSLRVRDPLSSEYIEPKTAPHNYYWDQPRSGAED